MFQALLYLQIQSCRNRVAGRVRRLRQPKYLFGALFGLGYFGLVFLRPFLLARHAGFQQAAPGSGELWEFGAGLLLFLIAILAWIIPGQRGGLVFNEAEIAFLFPAPVTRSALVHYKLGKAQAGILMSVVVLGLLSLRLGGVGAAGIRAAGLWLVLSVINLHGVGLALTRPLLSRRGWTLVLAAALVAGLWAAWRLPPREADLFRHPGRLQRYAEALADSAPAAIFLAPFRALVRPALSADGSHFWRALLPGLGILLAHYAWVTRVDAAFEEDSIEKSRRHAERAATLRGGNRWGIGRPRRKARPPFRLSPTGLPAVALLWKNLLGAGQFFSVRVAAPIAGYGLVMGYVFATAARQTAWPQILASAAVALVALSILAGAQIVRQDFRQDMPAIDLLKTYPLSGSQLALGQMLAPLVILTGFQWTLLGLAALFSGGAARLEWAASVALLAPPMNLLTLLLPNAAALLYPSWFKADQGAGRGLEVMGQRLIFAVALLLIFAGAAIPAVGVFGLVYFLAGAALPVGVLAAATVLTIEGVAGIAGLGYLFERFDPSAETAL